MLKKSFLIKTIILAALSSCAFADIVVDNQSDAPAVAQTKYGCSGTAGSAGTINPHSSTTVSQFYINYFCGTRCDVDVFMAKSCTGTKVARVTIEKNNGVVAVANLDQENYVLTGIGGSLSIKAAHRGFFNWFKSLLS